jgi:nicotinamide-nucleotide amidase
MQYDLIAACRAQGRTLATAESLTAGMVSSILAEVPGASAVLRGAVVAYATDVKHTVLGLDEALLEHVVSERVAAAMAKSVCALMDADFGLATTGVAGPDWLDGQAPDTAWIAVHDAVSDQGMTKELHLVGDRGYVREMASRAAIALLLEFMAVRPQSGPSGIA